MSRLAPCRFCGGGALEGSACARCGAPRDADLARDPTMQRALAHLQNLDRIAATIPDDVLYAAGAPPPTIVARMEAAVAEIVALLRIVPPGDAPMPGALDARLHRPTLEREFKRWRMLAKGFSPPPTLDKSAFDAHARWLRNGDRGQRIQLRSARLVRESYRSANLASVSIVDSDLSRVQLDGSSLERAELARCTLVDASLRHVTLVAAALDDVDLSRADLQRTSLERAKIARSRFVGGDASDTSFRDAVVRACDFSAAKLVNANLVGAELVGCSFRGATLKRDYWGTAPATEGARFIECDFTDADFGDRDLTNVQFVRCKLAAVQASAARTIAGVVVAECDVDHPTLARRIGPRALPAAGAPGEYHLDAEMSCADLRQRWRISTTATFDHFPTRAEIDEALRPVAEQTIEEAGGGYAYSLTDLVVKAG